MSFLDDGFGGYLSLLLAGVAMTQMWRWMGVLVGGRLSVDSPAFQWVRAVATALIAAMVSRMVLFPAGMLAGVPLTVRMAAFLGGLALYFAARRNLGAGVAGGALLLMLGAKLAG